MRPRAQRYGLLQATRAHGIARCLPVFCLATAVCASFAAFTQGYTEYELKAAFLFKFVRFIEWPAPAPGETLPAEFLIGVFGDDPFGRSLDEVVAGQEAHKRPVRIRRSREASELLDCALVFITRSERGHVEEALSQFKQRHILTVSDIEAFTELGGMICLERDRETDRIQFRVNNDVALEAGLRISAQLLQLAKEVKHTAQRNSPGEEGPEDGPDEGHAD